MELVDNVSMTVQEAAMHMKIYRLSAIGLVNSKKQLTHILSEQDLVRRGFASFSDAQVWQFATKDPVCVEDGEDVVERSLTLMAEKSFRHIPIVDPIDKSCKKILDIVAAVGSGKSKRLAHTLCWPAGKLMRIHENLGLSNLISTPGQSVAAAVQQFATFRRTALLVFEDENQTNLMGILTESDFVRKILAVQGDPTRLTVGDIMTKNPFTVHPSINPFDGLLEMIKHGFRHLPVVANDTPGGSILDILSLVKVSFLMHHGAKAKGENMNNQIWSNLVAPKTETKKSEEIDNTPEPSVERVSVVAPPPTPSRETSPTTTISPAGQEVEAEQEALRAIVNGDFKEAIRSFEKALGLVKDNVPSTMRIRLRRGHVESCLGNLDKALADFEFCTKALNTDEVAPIIKEATFGILEILIETCKYEEAVRRIEESHLTLDSCSTCIEQFRSEVLKYKDLGKELFSSRDYAGAIVAYTTSIRALEAEIKVCKESTKENTELQSILYGNRSACYQKSGDHRYAVEDAEKSISYNPTYWKSWVRKCQCEFDLHKYGTCLKSISQAADVLGDSFPESRVQFETIRKSASDALAKKKAETAPKNPLESIKSLGAVLSGQLDKENANTNSI